MLSPFLFRAQLGWKRPGASTSSCLLPLVIMYVGHLLEFLRQQREMCDQKRVDITNLAFLCLAHKQVQSMRSGTFLMDCIQLAEDFCLSKGSQCLLLGQLLLKCILLCRNAT